MDRERVSVGNEEIEYVDTGGDGPPIVLLHGALMDERLWAPVVARLRPRFRCVVPILPLGAHHLPRPAGADQSPPAIAALVGDLVQALALREVTLVGNDTGGALAQLLLANRPEAASRVVLVSCDAFDNFPPGLPGRALHVFCAVPGAMRMAMASLRLPPMRRLPMTFGWMAKRPIENAVFTRWIDAFTADRRVRRDLYTLMREVDDRQLVTAAKRLESFEGEALVVWAADDRVMPVEHAHRLSDVLDACPVQLVEDSYTLVPLDQPERLADLIEAFVSGSSDGGGPRPQPRVDP